MWFLLTLQLVFSSWAGDSASMAIEDAQSLALKRERQKACARLREALKTIPVSSKAMRVRVTESLDQVDKVFFTDKGQKEYEAGQSLMFENPDLALSKLQTALSMEDDNLSVLSTIAKVQLIKQDCDGAETSVARARALNPNAIEPALLGLRALLCKKKFTEFAESLKNLPPLKGWDEQYVAYISGAGQVELKNSRKGIETLLRVAEAQPSFPETFFYLARAGGDLNKDNTSWLRTYVSLCKAVSTKDRKRFSMEPRLCAGLKDAENELSKKSSDI